MSAASQASGSSSAAPTSLAQAVTTPPKRLMEEAFRANASLDMLLSLLHSFEGASCDDYYAAVSVTDKNEWTIVHHAISYPKKLQALANAIFTKLNDEDRFICVFNIGSPLYVAKDRIGEYSESAQIIGRIVDGYNY